MINLFKNDILGFNKSSILVEDRSKNIAIQYDSKHNNSDLFIIKKFFEVALETMIRNTIGATSAPAKSTYTKKPKTNTPYSYMKDSDKTVKTNKTDKMTEDEFDSMMSS